MLGRTDRGVCWLDFLPDGMTEADALQRLSRAWPKAGLLSRGTNFELWRALMRIPPGTVTADGELAAAIDRPGASRAVGRAVGCNLIGYLIPCHRVIRSTGGFASYRWGLVRKKAILSHEAARREIPSVP